MLDRGSLGFSADATRPLANDFAPPHPTGEEIVAPHETAGPPVNTNDDVKTQKVLPPSFCDGNPRSPAHGAPRSPLLP